MKKQILKNRQQGITLIALIVTIIVLLILVGVSLSLVAGSNGIIGKVATAVDKTSDATILEEVQLVISEGTMQYYLHGTDETLVEYLAKNYSGYETASGAIIDFDENGEITYSKGKETMILVMGKNGNIEMTEKITEDGMTIDKRAPKITIDAISTNSITFTMTDRVGIVAYSVTENEETPSNWTEIASATKFTETVTGKTQNTTYYIWAKDAAGNVSAPITAVTPFAEKTVSYDANGGTGTVPASLVKVKYGTKVTVDTEAKLTKVGYKFLGWALTNSATEPIFSFEMPVNNVTLYAVWQKWPLATDVVKAINYGDEVNYSANGISDWTDIRTLF